LLHLDGLLDATTGCDGRADDGGRRQHLCQSPQWLRSGWQGRGGCHRGRFAVDVDAHTPRAHADLILVNDDDGLAVWHVQAAPGSVKGDAGRAFWPVQDQALVGRNP
jgi:hypothetical protein